MHDKKLIELVRKNPALYDSENSKYTDNNYKDRIWLAIAKELNVPLGITCKTRWTQLRDQWRKNKNNKIKKSAASTNTVKKWRYDEQMSFLEPFVRPSKRVANLILFNDTEIGDTDTLENAINSESDENTSDASSISFTETLATRRLKRQLVCPTAEPTNDEPTKQKNDDPASSLLIKYFIQKQEREQTGRTTAKHPTDIFFQSISAKVKRFQPYYRNIAESKIFQLVQDLELKQIVRTQGYPQTVPQPSQQEEGEHTSNDAPLPTYISESTPSATSKQEPFDI